MAHSEFEHLYENNWSEWKRFPNPDKGEYLYAPFGHGVYQLRLISTEEYILFGRGKNVAYRMSSLLPAPKGQGTRNNKGKKSYVLENIENIEYRTIAFKEEISTIAFEDYIKGKETYIFKK